MINQQNVTIKNGSTWHKICPFPVGFIYLSQSSTSPATTFGGTWTALNEDRFLRPSNAWTTGGSKKISVDQMPTHNHNYSVDITSSGLAGYGGYNYVVTGDSSWQHENATYGTAFFGGGQITGPNIAIATVGIGQPNFFYDGGER